MRLIDIDDLIEAHYAACENDHNKSFETWSLELMKNAPTIEPPPNLCAICKWREWAATHFEEIKEE